MKITRRQALVAIAGSAAAPGCFAAEAPERTDPIKLLSFNIWMGGTRLHPLEQTAKVIRETGADFVGVQEMNNSGPPLAKLTGMHLFDQGGRSTRILSRWPVDTASKGKWGARYVVPRRGPVWVFNAHLPAAPYQPYQLAKIPYGSGRFIKTAAEAIDEARKARGGHVKRLLDDMRPALDTGEPIVLTGDFNEPSHHDWTKRAAEAGRCALPVAWPASSDIVKAGLIDAYRTVYPDEVKRPGLTWTPRPSERDVLDRIDFVYTRGLRPTGAKVAGESDKHADLVVKPYPSDHRAVLVTARFE